jgi:hypothetical protein
LQIVEFRGGENIPTEDFFLHCVQGAYHSPSVRKEDRVRSSAKRCLKCLICPKYLSACSVSVFEIHLTWCTSETKSSCSGSVEDIKIAHHRRVAIATNQ